MRLVALAVCAVASGCGTSDGKTATTYTMTAPPSTSTTSSATEPARPSRSGRSGDITLRVLGVRTSRIVKFLGNTQSNITPDAKPRTRKAKQGGHFVYVTTRVTNHSRVGLDLTCGLPISAILVDVRNRNFDPIDGLSQIANNPECNTKLQPGFHDRMTWIYLVPRGTVVDSFAFADWTGLADQKPYTQIVVGR